MKTIAIFFSLLFFFQIIGAATIQVKTSFGVLDTEEFDMIIVAPSEFSNLIQPFIDHKNNIGISSYFISIEDIYNEFGV